MGLLQKSRLCRTLLWTSFVLFIISGGWILSGNWNDAGILHILGLVCLALGVRGFPFWKNFSYTIFILASVSVAMYYPEYFIQFGDFELKGLIIPLLQIIMFGMGSQMSLRDFTGVIRSPKAVLIGVLCQFTIMPLVAVLLTSILDFPVEIAAGIILVGSSPSGLASNVMAFLAKANVALSVTLTAIATILAPLLTPLLMQVFAGQLIPIDFWSMMLGIMDMVILPIIAGLIFNALAYGVVDHRQLIIQLIGFFMVIIFKNALFSLTNADPSAELFTVLVYNLFWFFVLPAASGVLLKKVIRGDRELMDRILALVSMVGIGVIITVITAAGRNNLLEIGLVLVFACFIHNLFGYGLGYWTCRLLRMDEASCRTIALEVGMQNSGLASGIALQMGKVATVGLAPSVFGPLMNMTGSSLATWWRGREINSSLVTDEH